MGCSGGMQRRIDTQPLSPSQKMLQNCAELRLGCRHTQSACAVGRGPEEPLVQAAGAAARAGAPLYGRHSGVQIAACIMMERWRVGPATRVCECTTRGRLRAVSV